MEFFSHRLSIVLLGVEFFVAAVLSMVALLPLTGNPPVATLVILPVIILASALFLRGWLKQERVTSPNIPGGRSPEACWKYGLFYFNPDDPALFVEKRVGIGYTVNFAHVSAWIIMALTLLVPLGLAAWAISHH